MKRQGTPIGDVTEPKKQNAAGRIVHIELDERSVARRGPEVEQERAIAIYDLIEENTFTPAGCDGGALHLHLSIDDGRLHFDIRDSEERPVDRLAVPMEPFRRTVREYFMVCETYYDAIKRLTPSQIETIDMGRRALHDDGSHQLMDRLHGRVEMDFKTARRLFTLICVLHMRG